MAWAETKVATTFFTVLKKCAAALLLFFAPALCSAEELYALINYDENSNVYRLSSDCPDYKPVGFVFDAERALALNVDEYGNFRLMQAETASAPNSITLREDYYRGAKPAKVLSQSLGEYKADLAHISFGTSPGMFEAEPYCYAYEADKPGLVFVNGELNKGHCLFESKSKNERILCILPDNCYAVWGSDVLKDFLENAGVIASHSQAVCSKAAVYQRPGSAFFDAAVFSASNNTLYRFLLLSGKTTKVLSCSALKLKFKPEAICYDRGGILKLAAMIAKPNRLKTADDFVKAYQCVYDISEHKHENEQTNPNFFYEQFSAFSRHADRDIQYTDNILITEKKPSFLLDYANKYIADEGDETQKRLVLTKEYNLVLYSLADQAVKPKKTAKFFMGLEYFFAKFDYSPSLSSSLAAQYAQKEQFKKLIKNGVSLSTVPIGQFKSTYRYPKSVFFAYFERPFF